MGEHKKPELRIEREKRREDEAQYDALVKLVWLQMLPLGKRLRMVWRILMKEDLRKFERARNGKG